jgi:5-(carboxyamino)imidazole ribonucleotide synthase
MVKIGVIGGGQLARMMIPAAINLGVELEVFAEAEGASASLAVTHVGDYRNLAELQKFAASVDAITFDHEHVPTGHLVSLRDQGIRVFPPPEALSLTHDKIVMRSALQKTRAPQPRWSVVSSEHDRGNALAEVGGFPCIAKLPVGGYDGKGVRVVSDWSDFGDWLDLGPVLIEEKVDFVRELAQLVARRPGGQLKPWPVVETRQRDGVCSEVLAPAPGLSSSGATRSQRIAADIAEAVGLVGVLAVELFETRDGTILVNELAMRPHNSGHIFTELSRTSQFEQHLRAVADLPLGDTTFISASGVMVNVFGEVNAVRASQTMADFPQVKIHSYQKPARPGRKAGHLSVVGDDPDGLLGVAIQARAILDSPGYDGEHE